MGLDYTPLQGIWKRQLNFPRMGKYYRRKSYSEKKNIINPFQGLVREQLFFLSGLYPDFHYPTPLGFCRKLSEFSSKGKDIVSRDSILLKRSTTKNQNTPRGVNIWEANRVYNRIRIAWLVLCMRVEYTTLSGYWCIVKWVNQDFILICKMKPFQSNEKAMYQFKYSPKGKDITIRDNIPVKKEA